MATFDCTSVKKNKFDCTILHEPRNFSRLTYMEHIV